MGSAGDFHVLIIGGGEYHKNINASWSLNVLTNTSNAKSGPQFKEPVFDSPCQAGITYTLLERDSADEYWNKTRDWGMLLHWGKDFLMKNLPADLQARFSETLVDPTYSGNEPIPHINGETGEVIQRVQMPGLVRVSRKKLRTFLTKGQDLNISFKKRLSSISSTGTSVTATFEDGTQERGDFIVGTDGSRSKVREFLVGAEKTKPANTGMTIINHAASGYTAEQALLMRQYHPIAQCGYDPNIRGIFLLTTLDASDVDRPESWSFQVHHAWWGAPTPEDLKDPKTRLEFFKTRFSRLCEPFATASAALTPETWLPIDPGQQWSPIPWDNRGGIVTLGGDAAHSMLPNRGQGLNNAMQDAAEIVDAVKMAVSGASTLKEAVTAYEDRMRPRGANDVALSLETAVKTLACDLEESPMFKIGLQKLESEKVVELAA